MRRSLPAVFFGAVLAVLAHPAAATTGGDLSARIQVDGYLDDYAADEWVFDAVGVRIERADDSAWGSDNDVGRMALTWDHTYLYVGIECTTADSRLVLFVDHGAGGLADMRALETMRHAIVFGGSFRPDLAVVARPQSEVPDVWRVNDGIERVDDGRLRARYRHEGLSGGALEIAIPWEVIPAAGGRIALVAAVTGEAGSGCGDAVPGPNGALSSIRTRVATLDRHAEFPVDDTGDGVPDDGVAPRDVAVVAAAETSGDVPADADVVLDIRSFAPDDGERVTFRVRGEGDGEVFMTARVFARNGELVRVLYTDAVRSLSAPVEDSWDGTDRFGRVVRGGIYIIAVDYGAARGARDGKATAGVGVVR